MERVVECRVSAQQRADKRSYREGEWVQLKPTIMASFEPNTNWARMLLHRWNIIE